MTVIRLSEVQKMWRRRDAALTRSAIEAVAFDADGLYYRVRSVMDELRSDGGYEAAIGFLSEALWRLKQAETLMEKAKEKVQ